ncbi:unnamed protein product [Triticum turgidum subsp. durum]|uniref:WAT1-related protein n=1 Tax=Triticum turgidum subsp. durum TaxID=4567 RepID=A0A9R0QIY1_TRITD|nr:unnamed protein product [Triticum turgidum subsp. durum]
MADRSKKPYVVAVAIQAIYTGLFVVSKAAFDSGINTYVFIFYRLAAATALLIPIALIDSTCRRSRSTTATPAPALSCRLLFKLFLYALLGNTFTLNMYNVSLKQTSATVGSAATNSMPVATFLLAVLLRMEAVPLLKEYPKKLMATALQCLFGALQSFVVAVVVERDFTKWKLGLDIGLLAVLYSAFLGTGALMYLQAWCAEMRGPVFVAMWSPLALIFTILCSSFFLGEAVHFGSIFGGILLVGGLYSVLWGKSKEKENNITSVVPEESQVQGDRVAIQEKHEEGELTSQV